MDFEKFIRRLTETNRLAISHGFRFQVVSDLDGFAEAIADPQAFTPLVCLSDTSEGAITLDNAPATRTVKTIFLFVPVDIHTDWVARRQEAFSLMRELFRQFMTVLMRQATALRHGGIYIDPRISFTEIDRYFYTGGACAYFQIALDTPADLRLSQDEWTQDPMR